MVVTVIVPTWRRPEHLERCLDGLAAQTRAADEVLVVARADDEATWELLRARTAPALRLVPVQAPGVVASLNAGLLCAHGDILAITDDDAVPRPDWLARIERHFMLDPALAGVGGRDWTYERGRLVEGDRRVVGKIHWFGRVTGNHHLGAGAPRKVDILKGANMAIRAAAVEGLELGEGLRGSGAQVHWEIDLCLAVKRAGWTLTYDPSVAVDHHPAPRFDEDQRVRSSLLPIQNDAYNLTLTLARGLPRPRRTVALAYGLLVGTRALPGIVTGLEQALRGRRRRGALRACTSARLAAARDARRRRRAGDLPTPKRREPRRDPR